jgi:drug/metabolite transporter (DMT)-like permease
MQSLRWAYGWMLISAASFSVMSFLTHALRETFTWQAIAIVRTAIALVITIFLAKWAGARLVVLRPGTLWVRSIAGSVALLANFFAMTHYPVSEVLALSNMFPLWVAVLSWPVLGEKPKLDVWLAAAIGVLGVYLLQQRPQAAHPEVGVLPVITAVTGSLASAIALLGLHRLKEVDTRAVVAHFSGVSLAFSVAAMLLLPRLAVSHSAPVESLVVLLIVGLAATSGQLFLTKAFSAGPPGEISVVGLSQVGFAMLLEFVFSGRHFTGMTLFGLALVVLPTAWVLTRRARLRPPLAPVGDDAGLAETAGEMEGEHNSDA